MACGCALVPTTAAARASTRTTGGRPRRRSRASPDRLAAATTGLLRDAPLRVGLAAAGRGLVAGFTWERSVGAFEAAIARGSVRRREHLRPPRPAGHQLAWLGRRGGSSNTSRSASPRTAPRSSCWRSAIGKSRTRTWTKPASGWSTLARSARPRSCGAAPGPFRAVGRGRPLHRLGRDPVGAGSAGIAGPAPSVITEHTPGRDARPSNTEGTRARARSPSTIASSTASPTRRSWSVPGRSDLLVGEGVRPESIVHIPNGVPIDALPRSRPSGDPGATSGSPTGPAWWSRSPASRRRRVSRSPCGRSRGCASDSATCGWSSSAGEGTKLG